MRVFETAEEILIPVCATGQWFLVRLVIETGEAVVYHSISGHWLKARYELLIVTLWDVMHPSHAAAKNIRFAPFIRQVGGRVCGTHTMMRVEDIIRRTQQDYSHKEVIFKRNEVI